MLCGLQEEKAVIKAKADADAELQARASIAIPLVDEKEIDIDKAKSTKFIAGSSLDERKRKRREIKSQSVFGDAYSPTGSKRTRNKMVKTSVRLDGSMFGRGGQGKKGTGTSKSAASVREHRLSLGIIKPSTSTTKTSSLSS